MKYRIKECTIADFRYDSNFGVKKTRRTVFIVQKLHFITYLDFISKYFDSYEEAIEGLYKEIEFNKNKNKTKYYYINKIKYSDNTTKK
jgi:hypothetical protein